MRLRAAVGAAATLGLAACAGEPGVGWGPVELALDAHWQVPADRRSGDDEIILAGGWIVAVDEVVLTVATARLQAAVAGDSASTTTFDPANPPAGYANCHGGHCHADDGRLVAYEEIAAELAAGGATGHLDLMRFGGTQLDALTAGRARQATCTETCLLDTLLPSLLALDLAALQIRGHVRDGRAVPRLAGTHAFSARIPLAGLQLASPLIWPDRPDSEAPTWRLQAHLTLGPDLLDAVDWTAATGDPLVPDEVALEDLAVAAVAIAFDVEVQRD
jgi:hypothetical protein